MVSAQCGKERLGADGKPYITDGGHYILDCAFGAMSDPKETAHHLDHVVGLVEHGLFLKFATEAVIAGAFTELDGLSA